ncbi:MAG: hypothetical protein U0326_13670 [Polyangiales bacterium]
MRGTIAISALPIILATGCLGAAPDDNEPAQRAAEDISASAWSTVSGVSTRATPALRSLNGALHMVAISTSGTLRHSTTTTSAAGWSAPVDAGRPSAAALATDTAPVLLADGTTLYAFARGADNNLYRASRSAGGAWSAWTALTASGNVRGRISVAFSRYSILVNGEPGPSVLVTHALYPAASGGAEYARFENGALVVTNGFAGADEGVIASNGSTETYVALRGRQSMTVFRATRSSTGWGWTLVGTRGTFGTLGRVYDVSDLAYFAGAFHVVYSYRTQLLPDYNTVYRTAHARFIPGRSDDSFYRLVTTFAPSQDPDVAGVTSVGRLVPEATLAVYRNKLVAAYRMPDATVRYARWDNADPTAPWLGNARVASGSSHRRPALGAFNGRGAVTDYGASNYGDDLFAASVDASLAAARAVDFSRAIFKVDVGAQFNLYTSNSDTLDPVCRDQSDPYGPTPVSVASEDRPFVSELGFALWALPAWFADGLWRDQAQVFCRTLPSWPSSGRVPASCDSTTRMPVIVRVPDAEFVCRGTWVGRTSSYIRIWEELGHYSTDALGINDESSAPTADNASRTGIALTALQSAYDLFGLGVGTCGAVTGRCVGFTGIANNYDAGSREHSFLYTVYYYMRDGAQLRAWAAQDAAGGSTQLQRKYDWVRDNLFRGVEFNRDVDPVRAL